MSAEAPGPIELARRLDELVRKLERLEVNINSDSRMLTRVEAIVNELKEDIERIEDNQKADRQDIISNRRVAVSTAFVAVALLASIIFGILQLVLS